MKPFHIFLFIPLLPLLAIACTSADDDSGATGTQAGPLTLHAAIDAPVTRASGTQWEAGDSISVTVDISGKVPYGGNMPFITASGNGVFRISNKIDPYYINRNLSDPMTVTAFYPFRGTPEIENPEFIQHDLTAADQKDAKSRSNIDYLFARFDSQSPTSNVYLTFKHCMARVVFNFKAGDGIDGLEEITCIFNSVCKGTFNTRTGEAVATGTATDKLELPVPAGVTTVEYILFPQPADATKFTFGIKMNDKIYEPQWDDIQYDFEPLRAGNTYTLNVLFDNDTVIFTSLESGQWTDGGKVNIESSLTN